MSAQVRQQPLAPVAVGLAPELGARLRVLHASGDTLYAAAGLELLASTAGAAFAPLASAPGGFAARSLADAALPARLLRTGFHGLATLPNGDLLAIVRGALLHCAAGARRFTLAHRITRGTRPLGVCVGANGRAFFGEYFSNPRRDEVHVYATADGRSWEVVHSFARGAIRHVHGVHHDPYRGGLWVLTGDDGDEVGLWWTDDEFRTLEPVVRGDQRARAVTVLPLESGLLVPTDTPHERNRIQHLDPTSGALEELAELSGSVFCATRTSELYALSTAVEKSDVNSDQRSALYVSRDGHDWAPAARLERDLRWLRDRRGYLQYPTLLLPTGSSSTPDVVASGQSTAGCHGRLLRWSAADLVRLLEPPSRLRRSA